MPQITCKIVVKWPLPSRTDLETRFVKLFGEENVITAQHGADASTYKLIAPPSQIYDLAHLLDICSEAHDEVRENPETQDIEVECVYASTDSFGIWTFKNGRMAYTYEECLDDEDLDSEGHAQGQLLAFLEKQGMALNWN